MDANLLKVLTDVGFTDKEARVYTALTELGEGTVAQIAKKAELKRPIVYVVLGGLLARGYVSEIPNKKTNTYQATDASAILRRVQNNVRNFSQFIPVLRTLRNKGIGRPKISYFETKEGIINAWEEMNLQKEQFFITSYSRINQYFPGMNEIWVENYRNGHYKLKGYHITSDDPAETKYIKEFKSIDQHVRVLKELRGIKMDFAIYGNKIGITNLGEEPFLVVIESEGIADTLRAIFMVIWEKAKDVE